MQILNKDRIHRNVGTIKTKDNDIKFVGSSVVFVTTFENNAKIATSIVL